MDKFNGSWVWFSLAIAAFVTAVIAKGMSALFVLLAIAFVVAGIVFLFKHR